MKGIRIASDFRIVSPSPDPPSLAFIDRLIRFYNGQPKPECSAIWKGIHDQFYVPLVGALESGNRDKTADLLGETYTGMTVCGMDIGSDISSMVPSYVEWWESLLIRLANSCGALPCFNPEQPQDFSGSAKDLVCAIEAMLGFGLHHPGGGKQFGIEVEDRTIPLKLLEAACVATTLKRLQLDRDYNRVLEIGAGVGMLGFLLLKAFRSIYYQTIDLPIVSVIQAYLLAHYWESEICMAGEKPFGTRIKILGLDCPPDGQFDFVINQNSLPEMPAETVSSYLKMIAAVLNGYFVSVNHESSLANQPRVFTAAQMIPELKLIHRAPFWGRPGYVEEIWQKFKPYD